MSEVESQLALALGSEGTPSLDGSAAFDEVQDAGDEWEYKGEEIGEDRLREMQERLDGCVPTFSRVCVALRAGSL